MRQEKLDMRYEIRGVRYRAMYDLNTNVSILNTNNIQPLK